MTRLMARASEVVGKLLLFSATLILLVTACQQGANDSASDAPVVREGDLAPGFSLESQDEEISLDDYRGEKPVLLYFSMGPG